MLREALGTIDVELSISFVNDEIMQSLNEKWRGKDSTTDVLSFPMMEPDEIEEILEQADSDEPTPPVMLGDIVISLDVVYERSPGHEMEDIARLVAHGIAHLMGHDHHTDEETFAMRVMEHRLLSVIGMDHLLALGEQE